MTPSDISETQLAVILKLTEPGASSVLERWTGGFWAPPGTPWQWRSDGRGGQYRSPEWSVTAGTVRAMERLGLLRRTYHHPEAWRDDRELTEAWLDVAQGEHAPNKKSARQLEAERMRAAGIRSTAQQKISRDREKIASLEAEKRALVARLNSFARAARARTVIEPTTLVRGDRCQVVSDDRARQLRAEVDAFYDTRRRRTVDPLDERERFIREDIERTRDITAIQTKSGRRATSALRGMKRREAEQESDDAVERNIDPSLVTVWRKVKRGFSDSPRMSRTEAFLHWVEENPDEVIAILAEETEPTEEEFRRAQESEEAREAAARYSEPAPDDEVPF